MITLYPHLMQSATWATAITLYNAGPDSERVFINIRRQTGQSSHNVSIEANQRYAVPRGLFLDNEEFAVAIMHSRRVRITTGLYLVEDNSIKFFSVMPGNLAFPNEFFNTTGQPVIVMGEFNGYPGCCYLASRYGGLLNVLLMQDYISHGSWLQIGDCCPVDDTSTPGHPAGSHSGCNAPNGGRHLDMNYPLTTPGYTQYRPVEGVIVRIFDDNGQLIPHLIDWERLEDFLLALKAQFPKVMVRMDERITRYANFGTFVTGDPAGVNSHDRHMHVQLEG